MLHQNIYWQAQVLCHLFCFLLEWFMVAAHWVTYLFCSGHLTPRSDVYSFGVVLLELLTGRKSLDKLRPAREQNLTDWALPLLKEKKKLMSIVDPRLGGEYPTKGFHKAAMLAYHCLNKNPKARPLMRDIVDSLEPLQEPVDEPVVVTSLPKCADETMKKEVEVWNWIKAKHGSSYLPTFFFFFLDCGIFVLWWNYVLLFNISNTC